MKHDRIEYYDPLYETIILERNVLGKKLVPRTPGGPVDPTQIVVTPEFVRLAYLRQAGLGWLVFPSASHTRFAHSIGTWWLANIAESRIKVAVEGAEQDAPELLRDWLQTKELREEFYLALLLHDIGHGPLSHVVEHNEEFTASLVDAGVANPHHEHRAVDLLSGDGPLSNRWKEIARDRYGEQEESRHVSAILKGLKDRVCLPALYYSITKDETFRQQCPHSSHRADLEVVKEMVSGMLDLDRLDHSARDSYFSGLRQLIVNTSGLLSNLRVETSPGNGVRWFVSQDGATHAATLLFDRRLLFTTMFRNPVFLALTAMINRALSLHLLSIENKMDRADSSINLALMEDDQFVDEMSRSPNLGASALAKRVRCSRPYVIAGKWGVTEVSSNRAGIVDSLKEYEAKQTKNGTPTVILSFERDFWGTKSPERQMREWLDAKSFLVEGTSAPLIQHPDYRDDFEHLLEASSIKYLWAFAKTQDMAHAVREDVRKIVEA